MAQLKKPLTRFSLTKSYSRSQRCQSLLAGGVWYDEKEIVTQLIAP